MDSEVIVVGAGLSGLRCAQYLHHNGVDVIVVETADRVGGRVTTDNVDGFLVDRGFQVLNPAYPQITANVDVDALGMTHFRAGVLVQTDRGLQVVADPFREPRYVLQTLRSGFWDAREVVEIAGWMTAAMNPLSVKKKSQRRQDKTLAQSWSGVDGPLRHSVLDVFLGGVLADSEGTTSAAFVQSLVRYFALGTPGLPARGMQALPDQLAAGLGDRVRLNTTVTGVKPGVVQTNAGTLTADAVVVAAGPIGSETLGVSGPTELRGLTTWWFAAGQSPERRPFIVIDGRDRPGSGRGPVVNAAVVSAVAPGYAPQGRSLVQATVLHDHPGYPASEEAVRRHLGEMYSCSTSSWSVIACHDVPDALPAVRPSVTGPGRDVNVGEGVYRCGDHLATSSIDGAMKSGERAAKSVMADRRSHRI